MRDFLLFGVNVLKILGICAVVLLGVFYLIIFAFGVIRGKAIRKILLNGIIGITIWIIINLTAKYSGVRIPVNPYTAVGISTFSVPCIIALLVLQVLFKI